MSGQGPVNPVDWEAEINGLLDGELDEAATAALKTAAAEDQALALAIVEAWQLQQRMDQLQLEKAPASLARRLNRIPGEQSAPSRRHFPIMPRWAMAAGLASAVVAVTAMMLSAAPEEKASAPQQVVNGAGSEPAGGEPAQIEPENAREARQELAIAFSYLDKTGFRVSRHIQEVLSEELSAPVKDNLFKHIPYMGIPYTGQSRKEKHA